MNEKKLNQLFAAARRETASEPPAEFAGDILRAIRNLPSTPAPETLSLADQLNAFFPRIALACVAIMLLGLVADYGLSAAGMPGVGDGVAQISAQWFLNSGGF